MGLGQKPLGQKPPEKNPPPPNNKKYKLMAFVS